MKKLVILAAALTLAIVGSADAKQNKQNPSNGFCPPGLAKKDPPCIPPGQAFKYGIGDYIPDEELEDYEPFFDWQDQFLPEPPEGMGYYLVGDTILLLDQETGELINLFNTIVDILEQN